MYGREIIAAIQGAMKLPAEDLPVYPRKKAPRVSLAVAGRVKALRNWRDKQVQKLGHRSRLDMHQSAYQHDCRAKTLEIIGVGCDKRNEKLAKKRIRTGYREGDETRMTNDEEWNRYAISFR